MMRGEGVSVVMPCLNEEKTIAFCVQEAVETLKKHNLPGEVVVVDNGSGDNSVEMAESAGARVVHQPIKGYGSAYLKGLKDAKYPMIVIGDSDMSYDFREIPRFVEKMREGYDVVMGNRFKGGIEASAMPLLHKYFGNPLLSGLIRLLFKSKIGDCNCGLRAFTKEGFLAMNLVATGMEFAPEIVIKAKINKLNICEIPVKLRVDGRDRAPHLKSFRDGWRDLRYILLMSPSFFFQGPGVFFSLFGLCFLSLFSWGAVYVGPFKFDFQMMVVGAISLIIGFQFIFFDLLTERFVYYAHIRKKNKLTNFLQRAFTLEKGLIIGCVLLIGGVLLGMGMLWNWTVNDFHYISHRMSVWVLLLLSLGVQVISAAFILSFFDLNTVYNQKYFSNNGKK